MMPVSSVGHSWMQTVGSSAAPAVIKKTPSRIPSNGLMSASIWAR